LPKYDEVKWDLAECQGSYTDLFYSVEEERNASAYWNINAVRSICARCPIWSACLTYAFAYESYGVWGGLTSLERKSIGAPDKYPAQKQRALASLLSYGITLEEIRKCYEHSNDDGGLENQITYYRENGSVGYRRPRK
jgi:WhiB family redox-sensing transcriptional regulator